MTPHSEVLPHCAGKAESSCCRFPGRTRLSRGCCFFFLPVADDKLAKGGGDAAASSFSSVELSHSDFLRKIGKGSRDLEPQSSLLFHAKKKAVIYQMQLAA